MKVANIGKGQTFGDIDAYRRRNYMYSLKTASLGAEFYQVDAEKFVMLLEANQRLKQFK